MKYPHLITACLLAIAALTSSTYAQTDFKFAFQNGEELNAAQNEKLITGMPVIKPTEVDKLDGQKILTLRNMSSNYEGRFFKRNQMTLALDQPLTEEFAKWYVAELPARLVLKAMTKGSSTVYQIVGHSKEYINFEATEKLFPEFAEVQLADLSDKKTMKAYKKKDLIAGGITLNEPKREGQKDNQIDLFYPTFNYGTSKGNASYMATITLDAPFSQTIKDYIKIKPTGDLVFERVSGEGQDAVYQLIGFSKKKFTFMKGNKEPEKPEPAEADKEDSKE